MVKGTPAATAHLITDHRDVTINGKRAAWLFSEFETDKSLTDLVRWLTPKDWPTWGGALFKEMVQVSPEKRGASGYEWQAKYLEVVDLPGQQLSTVLRCDFGKTDDWAAMTYDLDHSVDNRLQVDRGFLLAVEAPQGRRQVKALKVVGFTNPVQTLEVDVVGPLWTEWVRAAIEVAAEEVPKDPSVGHHGPGGSRVTLESAPDYYKDRTNQWTDCVTDMAQFYSGYATDVGSRLYSGEYKPADAAQDSGRLFLRLARDWSRLCRAGSEMAEAFADADVPPTTGGDPTTDFTDVIVPAPSQPTRVSVGNLVKVGIEDTTLNPSHIEVAPESVDNDPDPATIRLKAHSRAGPYGLYAGHLHVEPSRHPAFVYISKARPVA
jgi:hypothetical protein